MISRPMCEMSNSPTALPRGLMLLDDRAVLHRHRPAGKVDHPRRHGRHASHAAACESRLASSDHAGESKTDARSLRWTRSRILPELHRRTLLSAATDPSRQVRARESTARCGGLAYSRRSFSQAATLLAAFARAFFLARASVGPVLAGGAVRAWRRRPCPSRPSRRKSSSRRSTSTAATATRTGSPSRYELPLRRPWTTWPARSKR